MSDNLDATQASSEKYDIHGEENDTSEENNVSENEISLAGVSLSELYNCVSTIFLGVQLVQLAGTASMETSSTQG